MGNCGDFSLDQGREWEEEQGGKRGQRLQSSGRDSEHEAQVLSLLSPPDFRAVWPSTPHLNHSLELFLPLTLPSVHTIDASLIPLGGAHTHPHLLLHQPHLPLPGIDLIHQAK